MRDSFVALGRRLLKAGISPHYVLRTIRELREHEADLIQEAVSAGCTRNQAEIEAQRRLGNEEQLIASIQARRELHARFKRANWLLYRMRSSILPQEERLWDSSPYGTELARWGMSACFSGMITFTLLFTMQAVIG